MQLTKFKKVALLAAAALTIAAFTAGCSSDKGGSASKDGDSIKLGANLEMTGGSASFGTSAADGIKLAIKEVNAAGGVNGKQVTLDIADNRSDVAEAANAMEKLVDDKVAGVVAPNTSSLAIATAPAVDAAKLVTVSGGASNPKVTVDPATGKVRPYYFRATFIDPFQGSVMANFVVNTLKFKTAAIFVDNSSDYSKGLSENFTTAFEKLGGKIVGQEGFLQKDTDFKAALTKIKAMNPDVIFIPAYYQEVGLIIKQAREMGITAALIGTDGWDSTKLPEIAGTANLKDVYFSNHYSVDSDAPKSKEFVANFQKEYNRKPDAFAALGYDAAMIILDAMKAAKTTDPAKLQAAVAATKNFDGATGKISLNENHDAVKAAIILSYNPDGSQKFITSVAP